MIGPKVTAKTFLHSCHIRNLNDGGDAVMVAERHHYEDGSTRTVLNPIRNPKRSFWITKPQCRTYTEKREIEDERNLDKFTVLNSQLNNEIYRALNGYYPKGFVDSKALMRSPYIYGADIDVQTLIKARYKKLFDKSGALPLPPTTGFFDIERSVVNATKDIINVISVTHENKIYTAIHELFFYKEIPVSGSGDTLSSLSSQTSSVDYGPIVDVPGKGPCYRVKADLEELKQMSQDILNPIIADMFGKNKYLKPHAGKLPFEFHYFVGKNEEEIIRWIFDRIHENRTNFMGVWNMDYDIPAIIQSLKKHDVKPEDVFCTPGLPEELKFFKYARDMKKVDHPADKWSWLHSSSCTQFYDAMCLYGKLRTVNGKESSYALDYILQKNGIAGKLHFPELEGLDDLSKIDWHRYMQQHEFMRYIVYNQADVIWIQLMEWLNNDANAMLLLSDVSHLSKFPRQTRKFADTMYRDWIDKGMVLGVPSDNMRGPYDDEMVAVGGAVLSPNRMDSAGLKCIRDYPNLTTQIHMMCNDIDFSGMYPNTQQAANVSKETKLSTTLYIRGNHVLHKPYEAVEVFFGYVVNVQDNAVNIGTEFCNLPGFEKMNELFQAEMAAAA